MRWVVGVLLLLATSTRADEDPEPRLRTFLGGFSSIAVAVNPVTSTVAIGPVGLAGDVGINFSDRYAVSLQLRGSTMIIGNFALLVASVEWTPSWFSLSIGAGGGALFTAYASTGPLFMPVAAIPLSAGVNVDEHRDGTVLRSIRINLELAALVSPAPLGVGLSVGLSVGALTR